VNPQHSQTPGGLFEASIRDNFHKPWKRVLRYEGMLQRILQLST